MDDEKVNAAEDAATVEGVGKPAIDEKKLEKPAEIYVPLTPMQKVAQRLGEGKPLDEILRYMHGQSKVLPEIRALVSIAVLLEEGLKPLNNLTREGDGGLRTSPGSALAGASDLVVQVGKLRFQIDAFKKEARARVAKLVEEHDGA